jgi:hypothetical protein
MIAYMAIPAVQVEPAETIARWAYKQADAMLKARTEPPQAPRRMDHYLDDDEPCPADCWCQTGIDE